MPFTIQLKARPGRGVGLSLEDYETDATELYLFWSSFSKARRFPTEREALDFIARIKHHYPQHEGRLTVHRRVE